MVMVIIGSVPLIFLRFIDFDLGQCGNRVDSLDYLANGEYAVL